MIALLVGLAAAGGLGDLARLGKPSVVASCHGFDDMAKLGRAVGMQPPLGAVGPVHMVVLGNGADQPAEMVMEFGADGDPDALISRIGQAHPTMKTSRHGERVRLAGPHPPAAVTGDATALAVRALKEDSGKGCVAAMVLQPGSVGPIPGEIVASFGFRGWDQPLLGRIDLPANVAIDALLDGEGEAPTLQATSVHRFATAVQIHGTLPEAAVAMATADPSTLGPMVSMLSLVPRRVSVARGTTIGLDAQGRAWGAVIPLERPAKAKAVRRLARKGLRRMGLIFAELDDGRFRISPLQGPPILVGLRDGWLVASTRDDVVFDMLAGAGEPWIDAGDEAYGLRMRTDSGEGWLRMEDDGLRFQMLVDPDALSGAP